MKRSIICLEVERKFTSQVHVRISKAHKIMFYKVNFLNFPKNLCLLSDVQNEGDVLAVVFASEQ